MVAYLNFLATYNNGGATPNMTDARKPLIFKAFRASLTLVPAGYIAPGNAECGGDLPLGQGDGAAQAVAQADDLRLPGRQALLDQSPEPLGAVPVMEVLQHGVIYTDDVH